MPNALLFRGKDLLAVTLELLKKDPDLFGSRRARPAGVVLNLPFTVRQKGALRSGQIDRKEGTVVKILNFGSLNLDKVYKVAHFVREGETISAQEQNQFLGGKGLNQSVALARAGIFVEHAGAVGRETTEFHALLKAEGAGTTYLRVLETVSGHAVIQSCAGQNCIIVYGGAKPGDPGRRMWTLFLKGLRPR